MKSIVVIEEDQLMFKIKEAVLEAFSEKNLYPSPRVDKKKLMTRNEVAAYLGISPNTVTKLHSKGKLIGKIVGPKYRFYESDVTKYLNQTENL